MQNTELKTIDADKLIRVLFISCVSIELFLVCSDYIFNYIDVFDELYIRRIWNMAREQSIPTWFSSIQTQLLGVTVICIGVIQQKRLNKITYWSWIGIGIFFLWIGIDDFAEIHEKLGGALERLATDSEQEQTGLTGILLKNPSFSWHTFVAPFFALVGAAITAFLWLQFRALKLFKYVFFGFGCWVVSQGLDFIEGLDDIDIFYTSIQTYIGVDEEYFVPHTFKVIEEFLEMFGTTLLWVGFLNYLAHASNGRSWQIKSSL